MGVLAAARVSTAQMLGQRKTIARILVPLESTTTVELFAEKYIEAGDVADDFPVTVFRVDWFLDLDPMVRLHAAIRLASAERVPTVPQPTSEKAPQGKRRKHSGAPVPESDAPSLSPKSAGQGPNVDVLRGPCRGMCVCVCGSRSAPRV